MSDTVIFEREGPIAILKLNRPEKLNALNGEMSAALIKALDALEADDSCRVVVITGHGTKAFCAGADMQEQLERTVGPQGPRSIGAGNATLRVLRFPKPVIAAVNGYAFGGGALLAICCDLRLAAENASFRFPGAEYGLIVGGSQLPRIVGPAAAKELIFTARRVEAEEALRLGLVNRVLPADKFWPEVMATAQAIAANSPAIVSNRLSTSFASIKTFMSRTPLRHLS